MKIVKVIGGLGNQMFQFALYKALQNRFPKERILLDLHCFNGYHKHRGFEIGQLFHADYEEASLREVAKEAYPYPNYQCWRFGSRILPNRPTMLKERPNYAFEPSVFSRKGDTYYDGYWQHEDYFSAIRKDLLQTFVFTGFEENERNLATARLITSKNSCAIHIRRGDYVKDKLFRNICGIEYYKDAIQLMTEKTHPEIFCIFSDDIHWCHEHLSSLLGKTETVFADWNTGRNSFYDMHLMSLCRHQIIANSSFSWWGAWLNRNDAKVVIGPRKWWNINGAHTPISNSWLII